MNRIVLATRGSPLALRQAEMTQQLLSSHFPQAEVSILKITTTGDRQRQWSLEKKGGKGLFTKQLEDALLNGEADIAVHSAKDMPTEEPDGLCIAGYLAREDAHDMLICRKDIEVPETIATGSPRRRSQLKKAYPKAVWLEMRGNVSTRLDKIAKSKQADATVLAAAGLIRLGIPNWPGLTFTRFNTDQMVPAAGQGAIALQMRTKDRALIQPINDIDTQRAVELERCFLKELSGGCHSATAAHVIGRDLFVYHEDKGFGQITLPSLEICEKNLDAVKDYAEKFL